MKSAAGYDDHDRARRIDEPPKRSSLGAGGVRRSEFERDRARVLHCSALRRLAAKTQVVEPGSDDFPRTRLTHTLEVAQIGREMGQALGCDPDLVDAAGLAHDVGHPPFGHNGEDALDALAGPCGGFEGNAQSLRVLVRLETKVLDAAGDSAGLNLTRAVLDAATKYPWPRRPGERKYGVYADDLDVFQWLRDGAPPGRPCLEAQVMDWADDVAYSVHDVEDGVYAGHVSLAALDSKEERAAVCDVARSVYAAGSDDLEDVLVELLALPVLRDVAAYDGSLAGRAALKRATSELTGRFTDAAVQTTRLAVGDQPLRRYAADLVVPPRVAAECALLKAVAARYVMARRETAALQARQRELLTELVATVLDRPEALDPLHAPRWLAAGDDAARRRVVLDQVASLTDTSAVSWHAALVRG
ncbi:MAG: deoxyguanosinetriphosphate triphosphohydrolase [Geodermatophilaceae bacterium]|nr:deoxyguanosinetriphosphate triphosphohydrolase [Geodermatophilaceae bacterium]MDQ3465295.1 deoxyguanosinetriphosphate triphosphohydrolase [Actinomycetota bacterium]